MFSHRIIKSTAPLIGTAVAGGLIYASVSQGNTLSRGSGDEAIQKSEQSTEAPSNSRRRIFTSGLTFQNLVLESSETVNHNTKKLRFALPDKDAVSGLQACSALLTKATPAGSWLPVIRPYTPISDPNSPGHIDLLVKRYPTGKMSNHLHSLQPGQTHSFKTGPLSDYLWTPNKHSHLALITGGAGITPMYQLTQAILNNPADETKISLVFGVNTDADVLFRQEFQEMERKYPNRFKAVYTVSNPSPNSEFKKGYIDRKLLESTVPGPKEEGIKVLFCGPPAMEEAIVGPKGSLGAQGSLGGMLKEMGYEQEQVFKL